MNYGYYKSDKLNLNTRKIVNLLEQLQTLIIYCFFKPTPLVNKYYW